MMNFLAARKWVYKILVDSHLVVRQEYARYLGTCGENGRGRKLLEIFRLNWRYRILHKNPRNGLSSKDLPEGKCQGLPTAEELAEKLAGYDVVSFDIFDTLIMRAVENPKDVFRLLEGKWRRIGFAGQRVLAEQKARINRAEIKISDIYKILHTETAVGIEEGIQCELDMERRVCYANPYMKEVYERLIKAGKKIIAVSDMYIPHDDMRQLLAACGYDRLDRVFVSCDYGVGKGAGGLQELVKQELGEQHYYIHIGDNMLSDIQGSAKAGWDTFYYPNVHAAGFSYRQQEMTSLAASFYSGLVNCRLHCGTACGGEHYQYGYVYGGILVMGYCQYLERLAHTESIDQFLFVARDGYIINKIYTEFFHAVDCAYIPFSRFASYQITMERSFRNFLANVVRPRLYTGMGEHLGRVLEVCGITCIEKYLNEYGLSKEMDFKEAVYHRLEKIFEEQIKDITQSFAEQEQAAAEYFSKVIGSHKNICVVDIGWAGTSIACLQYFLKEKCGMPIQVCGALMGMNGAASSGTAADTEFMHAYLFSHTKNHENLIRHIGKVNQIHYRNLLVEILFTEDQPSFLQFCRTKDGRAGFVYSAPENNARIIHDIQAGMYDFSRDYSRYDKEFEGWLTISGYEAYLPLNAVAEAGDYCLKIFGDYEINENSGNFGSGTVRTFREIASG